MKTKKGTEVKVRLTPDEKGKLSSLSADAGMSMSDYIRSCLYSENKIILLSEGAEIAKNLFLIHNDLACFRSSGNIQSESVTALTKTMENLSSKINSLVDRLSDIHSNFEEGNENE
mgnify:CR=1 FL=1